MSSDNTPDLKIDFRKWAWKFVSRWWLFVICLGIAVPLGQAYLRYSTPKYMTRAKLLIKGVQGTPALSEISILSEGLGLNSGGKDLTNEIEILKSRPVLTKVVNQLNINVTYYRLGVVRDTELYKDTPLLVSEYEIKGDRKNLSFYIKVGGAKDFEFSMDRDTEGEAHVFGQPFENKFGRFVISVNPEAQFFPGSYQINVMHPENVANAFKNALTIELVGGQRSSSVLELKLVDPTATKAADVLNTLISVYNEEEIADNNVILKNTVDFVGDRITRLSNELDSIESNIEGFKSANNIITETAASSLDFSLGELRSALGKLAELELERELLSAVETNIKVNPESLIPTNVSADAPVLAGLIEEYNQLFLDRKKLSNTVSVENPLRSQATTRLEDLRGLISRSLSNLQANLEIPINQTKDEIRELRGDLNTVPSVEKRLIEKLRMQSIKENLYLFLLQKKEETELSMAISTANTRIIEPARSGSGAIFPNRKFTRLASVSLGLLTPILLILLLDLLKTSVDDEETIKGLTTVPIMARIPHYEKNEPPLLKARERSIRAEMFKLLRTNLNFTNLDKKKQVFVITSSVSGEGKSITAINLAITLSLANKKVVVVDMDLRKPKISQYLEKPTSLGVTSYLIQQAELSDVLNNVDGYPNFSFIGCGPIPPNPTEMIMSERTGVLIEQLKKDFDYVIIDCPPIGIVTDGLLLRAYLTNMLYVVRHGKTKKESLRLMQEQYQKDELVNPSIIINDINVRGSRAYGGYNSGSGYGYYLKN
ncbi:polysaccharide biosynthesis tyrosine autokinase [Roseivirga sp.]|uniref:polysaccharide biosynthesis tyrosine autokinase n=1 Tax=Roseivirga sp. TaxID=1964215 RepID=UPI003B8C3984